MRARFARIGAFPYLCSMIDYKAEILTYYEMLCAESGTKWVELRRFTGIVINRVNMTEEQFHAWLLSQDNMHDRIFGGSCYVCFT